MIRFACPSCNDTYEVDDSQANQAAKCSRCNAQFIIPSSSAPAPVPPPLPPTPSPEEQPPPLPLSIEQPPPMPPPLAMASVYNPPPPPPPALPSGQVEIKPCPKCNSRAQVDVADLGSVVECPTCLTSYTAVAKDVIPPPPPVPPKKSSRRDEDEQPAKKKRKRDWGDDRDDDEDEEDDRPRRRRRSNRPSNIQAIAGLLLGGGIFGILYSFFVALNTLCLWPGIYFGLVWSIMAIIRGANMLKEDDLSGSPQVLCILQIVLILNCDVVNLALGIVGLILLNDDKVRRYYERLKEMDS